MKKRKIAVLIFSMLLSASVFAGCGQENSSSNPVSSQGTQEQSAPTSQTESQVISSETSSQPISSTPSVVAVSSAPPISSAPAVSSATPAKKTFTKAMADKYESILFQYQSEGYTLYDINKDNLPELIIKTGSMRYIVYTINANQAVNCGEFFSGTGGIYRYNGNGIIVHDGGSSIQSIDRYSLVNGALQTFSVMNTVNGNHSDAEIENALAKYTPLDFYVSNQMLYNMVK